MFPEGTRNASRTSLLPFKKGAFRVAITCQVPILPVVYSPYYYIDDKKKYFGRGMEEVIDACWCCIEFSTRGSQKIRFPIYCYQITSRSEMPLYSLITHFTSPFFHIIIITTTTATKKYKLTGPSPITSQTLQYTIMKKEHVC
jgi:hypothetical protein